MLVIFGLFLSVMKLQNAQLMKMALKFIGLYVLLDAIKAPLHLLDGRHFGDGAKLSELAILPEIVWVLIWLVIGLSGLYYLWRRNT